MVHSAFHIEPVLKRTQYKISTLEVWGQKVLVGTEEGALLILEEQSGTHIVEFDIVETRKSFSKKPLSQIQAVDSLGILLSLSSDLLQVNDLASLDMKAQLLKTRGAHCFSISTELDTPVLCCAVKKSIVLYRWDGSLFSEWKDINVSDVPRGLVWCGDSICTNIARKYHLINVFSLSDKSLFDCSSATPTIFRLPGKREMLLGRDSISVFQDFEGRPSRKYAVTWSDAPIACVYSAPFLLGVLPKSVEVQLVETQAVVQSMSLRATHVAAGADGAVLVVANNCVYRLRPVPMARQVPPSRPPRTRPPARPDARACRRPGGGAGGGAGVRGRPGARGPLPRRPRRRRPRPRHAPRPRVRPPPHSPLSPARRAPGPSCRNLGGPPPPPSPTHPPTFPPFPGPSQHSSEGSRHGS